VAFGSHVHTSHITQQCMNGQFVVFRLNILHTDVYTRVYEAYRIHITKQNMTYCVLNVYFYHASISSVVHHSSSTGVYFYKSVSSTV